MIEPLHLFSLLLISVTIALAGYSLHCVCRARRTKRNPRPFAMPVFSLLAFAAMKVCFVFGGFVEQLTDSIASVLLATDYAMVCSIGWLLYHATKRRSMK